LSSIGFSSIESQFNDPKDVTCVTLILQFIGGFLPFIESTRLNLERITEAIVGELSIITNGDGSSSSSDAEEKINTSTN